MVTRACRVGTTGRALMFLFVKGRPAWKAPLSVTVIP
jgi:hypothetical protein